MGDSGRLGWSGSDKHLLRQRVPLCRRQKAEVKNMEEHDNKKRTAVWLTPGVIRRMDSWLEEDNCKTRVSFQDS